MHPTSAPAVSSAPLAPNQKRYGTIAARHNTSHQHRLGVTTATAKAGTVVYLDVKDVTRHPAEADQAKWICKSIHCAGKHWPTKRELLAGHPDNRDMQRQQETHLYMAVYECEPVPAQPEVKDKDGKVTRAARDAQPAVVLLLSDEE